MKISEEAENWIYRFIENELHFVPNSDPDAPFLPFAINRPFAVYDIRDITEEQVDQLCKLVPNAFLNCTKPGYLLYAVDWFHGVVLYDPRNLDRAESSHPEDPWYHHRGFSYYFNIFPDGDYYFILDRYGYFGYLTHPWRQEIWVYGIPLLGEFEKIAKDINLPKKASLC